MKKFKFIFILLIICISLFSCGNINEKDKREIKENIEQIDADKTDNTDAIKSAEDFFSDTLSKDNI
jgi:argininosuccinate lyase